MNSSNAKSVTVKAKWTLISYVKNFSYTGATQTFTAPYSGYYKLEVWGAEGGQGSYFSGGHGGYGGYATGVYKTSKNQSIYLQIGGYVGKTVDGQAVSNSSGWNGGGLGSPGGGGATSITTTNRGELSKFENHKTEVIIVAGGGGGDDATCIGGSGGGYQGGDSTYYKEDGKPCRTMSYNGNHLAYGATQSAGGKGYVTGTFGQGGSLLEYKNEGHADLGGGGGGGWYGGGSGGIELPEFGSGGGGSGYIGSSNLLSVLGVTKHMYCYNCGTTQTNASYRTTVGLNHSTTATPDYSKEGSGYTRITWMGDTL